MTEHLNLDPESRWIVTHRSDNSIRVEHEADGVIISVEPVYQSSTHKSSSRRAKPRRYRVQLKQDWFGTAVFGDQQTSGSVKTFPEALELSRSFIQQYDRNRQRVDRDTETIDSDTGVADADSLMATEAATRSVMDVAGYSDEYLVETLQNLFGDGLKLVVHCNDDTTERIFSDETADIDALLWSVGGLATGSNPLTRLSPGDEIYTMILHAGDHRWIRFVSTETRETVIVVDDDYPLELAGIERIIDDIVAEYHDSMS